MALNGVENKVNLDQFETIDSSHETSEYTLPTSLSNQSSLEGAESNAPFNVQELQMMAQNRYLEIISQVNQGVGQFKKVAELIPNLGVAFVSKPVPCVSQTMLTDECAMLKILSDNGFPVVKTYGEVFDIAQGRPAVLMDWIPNAKLWDAKDPDAHKIVLASSILDMPLPHGEAFVLHIESVKHRISEKITTGEIKLEAMQTKALKLAQEFSNLFKTMTDTRIRVGDLQLLIDTSGKISIIDPLAVMELGSKSNANYSTMVDMLGYQKENHPNFVSSILASEKMLEASIRFCAGICELQDNASIISFLSANLSNDTRDEKVFAVNKGLIFSEIPKSTNSQSSASNANTDVVNAPLSLFAPSVAKPVNKRLGLLKEYQKRTGF